MRPFIPGEGDALLAVDVQNDFLPGGTLAVPDGHRVIPPLNRCIREFTQRGLPVYFSRDWHPQHHCSFKEQGGPWPPHCIAETEGAGLAAELTVPSGAPIVSKATEPGKDAYSAFEGTELKGLLSRDGVTRLFVGGLATDYCVLNTVRDALRLGFHTVVLEDAIAAVNADSTNGAQAIQEMREQGAVFLPSRDLAGDPPEQGVLLTDLYQLTMLKSYQDHALSGQAVFEFFVRRLPEDRNFLVAAGLEQVLQYLESLQFTAQDLEALKRSGRFDHAALDYFKGLRFTGDVDAVAEGTVVFANEPLLRIRAPLPEAQLVESRIINLLQYQTLIASKAARMTLAAPGKTLVDFGLRRAHGAEAGLLAARASYLAGFAGTATVAAEPAFGVPLYGTMAHSFVQVHDNEEEAFRNFESSWGWDAVLLLDTYDTLAAADLAVRLLQEWREKGRGIRGVRLDSGNLDILARQVREKLDAAGFEDVLIFVSGNLDEYGLQKLIQGQVPVDGVGIGTRLAVSADAPYMECAYKLEEYESVPRFKRSTGKATLPGAKQVFRSLDGQGLLVGDCIALEQENLEGEPLLDPVMRSGRRLAPPLSMSFMREYCRLQLNRLPKSLQGLDPATPLPVRLSGELSSLCQKLGINPGTGEA